MLTNVEKINLINYKIYEVEDMYNSTLINIENFNSEDAETTVEDLYSFKNDLEIRLGILQAEKQALTNQG